jgi:hypothetical protein
MNATGLRPVTRLLPNLARGRPDPACSRGTAVARNDVMLWSLFVSSLVLWAFGVVSAHTMGGRIHVLLGVAIAVIVIRIVQGYHDRIA